MEAICSVEGCKNNSISLSFENKIHRHFCSSHMNSQSTKKTKVTLINEEKSIEVEEKLEFLNLFNKILNKTLDLRQKIISLMKKITLESEKIVKNLKKTKKQIKVFIRDLNDGCFLRLTNNFELIFDKNLLKVTDLGYIEETLEAHKKKYNFFEFEQNEIYLKSGKQEVIFHDNQMEDKKSDFKNFLHFFKDQTNYLISLNLEDLSESKNKVEYFLNGLSIPNILQLDERRLFVQGGRDSSLKNYYSSAFILDIQELKLHKISESFPTCLSKPVIFYEKIFIFGGFLNEVAQNISQVVDLKTNECKKISDLPVAISDTSSVKVKNKLLITGDMSSCLFLYNPCLDTFETVKVKFSVNYYNVLVKYGKKLFIVTDKVFECDKENICKWKVVSENGLTHGNIVTSGVAHRSFKYFASYQGRIFRFDCEKKVVHEVHQIN